MSGRTVSPSAIGKKRSDGLRDGRGEGLPANLSRELNQKPSPSSTMLASSGAGFSRSCARMEPGDWSTNASHRIRFELDNIEILWKNTKQEGLSFCAYLAFHELHEALDRIVKKSGSEYPIGFAT